MGGPLIQTTAFAVTFRPSPRNRVLRYTCQGVMDMKLLKTKVWNWWDVGLLKWCAFLFGICVGAYFHEYITPYVWIVLVAAILLTIRPAIAYWKD